MDIKGFRKRSKEQSGKDGEFGTKADPRDPCPALVEGAAPTPDPAIAGGPEIKSHSATKGLFAHIQSNNFKSLIVFVVFLFLMQVILVAVTIMALPFEKGNYRSSLSVVSTLGSPDKSGLMVMDAQAVDIVDEYEQENISALQTIATDFVRIWDALANYKLTSESMPLWILGYSLVYVISGIFSAAIFVRRQTGAHRVEKFEEPRLYAIIERLTITRGLPMPGVEIIEAQGRNAYASGFHPRNSAIGVSRGLLDALNDPELEAVLAHEIAHIEGRDNRLMTFANVSVGAISAIGKTMIDKVYGTPIQSIVAAIIFAMLLPLVNTIIFLLLIYSAWVGAEAIRTLISQKREFIADARAIEIMKSPEALISALTKVSRNDEIAGLNPDVQAMMISNLSGTNQGTHPTIAARIYAIEQTTSVNYADIKAMENIVSDPGSHGPRSRSHQASGEAGAASFGKREKTTHQKSSEGEQLVEGEKRDQVFKAYKRYERTMTDWANPARKFRLSTRMAFIFVPMIAAWLSNLIGIPWQATILMIIGGLFVWKYQHKFI